MPCSNASHAHEWPDTGKLFICRCELKCGYCSPAAGDFISSQTLRVHVKESHIGGETPDKPQVKLVKGYSGRTKEGRCPCELYAEGLLGPSPEKTPIKNGTSLGKRKRDDSEDKEPEDAGLRHVRAQLESTIKWALQEGLVDEVSALLHELSGKLLRRE
ncbi:hypothetical protein NA57DRAFT_75403 [Rhizodiscina lignyota]|uniref:Uncharacterized protein n=1 Tax=Rhizodiscina lignyota TaxID=1504668 RepID=A0A9P4III2_9PEZI|nr:hypothetical protein NA57DRAFT_75403 [Rhizodiscina lignyota]